MGKFSPPGSGDGHPRPADHPSVTLAEWHCRTPDRYLASRVLGSTGDFWRGAPTTDPFRLCDLLQSDSSAFGFTQRRAIETSRPTVWQHCRNSRSGRVTSSIRSDMIFGKDKLRKPARCQRTSVSGRMAVMTLRTDANHRYSWIKNMRSLFVSRIRLCTIRRNTATWCRSAAFSASIRLFDLNGETKTVRTKRSSATIVRRR